MSGDLPGDATAALRHKVAVALHDLECGDRACEPLVMGKFYRQADAALAAAAPHIDAAARAAEQERIRQQFLDVVTANVTAGNDTVYGALLDAIRELGAP